MSPNSNILDEFCVYYESDTDDVECRRKVARERRAVGSIRSLFNVRSLQNVLYESLLVLVLTYSCETMIWREKEKSRIMAV